MGIGFNNHRSPSVGEERVELSASHWNVTGWGDALDVKFGLSRGMDDITIGYVLPVTSGDTLLSCKFEKNDSEVIEAPSMPLISPASPAPGDFFCSTPFTVGQNYPFPWE